MATSVVYVEDRTLADPVVACVITYSTYCGVSVDKHARVRDWLQRFYARNSYRTVWGDSPGNAG